MDSIELTMDIEDHFDIRIDDEAAADVVYMRDLQELVVRLLREKPAPPGVCPSMHAFHQARRAILEETVYAVPRLDVRLDTSLEALVVGDAKRDVWRRIRQRLRLRPPKFSFRRPLAGLTVPSDMSVRELVAQVVDRMGGAYYRGGAVDEEAVWESVCRITADLMGVRASELKPDIHLVRDLNMS